MYINTFHWTHFRFKLITDDVKDCAHGGWNFIQNYDKVRLCSVSGLSAPGSDLWLHQRLFVTDFGENNCSLFVATCSKISLPQIVPCLQNLLALLFSNFSSEREENSCCNPCLQGDHNDIVKQFRALHSTLYSGGIGIM